MSVSKGIGIGIGFYIGMTLAAIVLPLLGIMLLCGGCAIIGIGGAAATANRVNDESNKAIDEAQATKAANEAAEKHKKALTGIQPPTQSLSVPEVKPEENPKPSESEKPVTPTTPEPTGPILPKPENLHTFTDKTGSFKVRAELLVINADKSGAFMADLRKEDGKVISVSVEKLSKEDKDWAWAEHKRLSDLRDIEERKNKYSDTLPAVIERLPEKPRTEKPAEPPAKRPSLTMENYLKVKTGMTFKEVIAIIGNPSEELSRVEIGGQASVIFAWKDDGAFGLGNCNITFSNGKVAAKAQFGLK